MRLELHDSEEGNTLSARVNNIDYDYQAEQWVMETHDDLTAIDVVKWELHDDQGIRCVWERPIGSGDLPEITQRSERFVGEWEKGPNEVAI